MIDMPKINDISLTSDELHLLFKYDPDTGKLYNRTNRSNRALKGVAAGWLRPDKYYGVNLNRVGYLSHRLIWIMSHGSIPSHLSVDHIDGNPSNNRIENLRLVTHKQNISNQTRAKGYYKDKRRGKWAARIKISGKIAFLGSFDNKESARAAYLEAKNKYCCIYGPNMKIPKKPKTKGYCWEEKRGRWKVSIYVNGKNKHLRRVKTEVEAKRVYETAKAHYLSFTEPAEALSIDDL